MEGNNTESRTTSIQAETLTQNCDEKAEDPKDSQDADEGSRSDGEEKVMTKGEEDPSISAGEALQQEAVNTTNTQRDEDGLLRSHLSTEEQTSATSVSSHPSITQNQPSDPCWYCLRSLDSDPHTKATEQEDSVPAPTPLSSGGQTVSYQTDPRPHFGVACSSRSTCRPLWGSEGPCWGQRNQESPHQTHTCPHCHLELPPDTLSWHESGSTACPTSCISLQGLTYLGLSYSCLPDELMELCQSQRSEKLVCSRSGETLASSCPDLKVHLSVEKIISTDSLAQILLPEIPLRTFQITSFYYPNESFSIQPLLCHMLPPYRHRLQYLTLDVPNHFEVVDKELLRLGSICKHLVDLKIRAFMDVFIVGILLRTRLKQRSLLNKITVKIYSLRINVTKQEDDVKEVLSFYEQQFPVIPVL